MGSPDMTDLAIEALDLVRTYKTHIGVIRRRPIDVEEPRVAADVDATAGLGLTAVVGQGEDRHAAGGRPSGRRDPGARRDRRLAGGVGERGGAHTRHPRVLALDGLLHREGDAHLVGRREVEDGVVQFAVLQALDAATYEEFAAEVRRASGR